MPFSLSPKLVSHPSRHYSLLYFLDTFSQLRWLCSSGVAIAQLNANKVNRRDDVLFYILNEIQNGSAKETGENYASVFKEAVALKGL